MSTLVIADAANPGKSQISAITATSSQITAANSVAAAAVVGVTTSAGGVDSGAIPKLNGSGLLDSSFLAGSNALIILEDQKSAGVDGGGFTSGAYRTRDLNVEVADTGNNCTLAANQFTLLAGTYRFLIICPACQVDEHVARLYNITDSSAVKVGSVQYNASGANYATGRSFVMGRVTIASSKTFEVQHKCMTTRTVIGFGIDDGALDAAIYTQAMFWKE